MTLSRGAVAMCAAQACAQIGAFGVAALLPTLITAWSLSNTEAGWISGIYYAAYTVVVPLLSSLTRSVGPKGVYLGSVGLTAVAFAGFAWGATGFWSALMFRALMGAGWAGSYMPGLKALSDLTEGPQQSRAVAAHAAAVGVSGALSFGIAGAVNAWLGWQWALVPGALGAALAFVLVLVGLPARPIRAAPGPRGTMLTSAALAAVIGFSAALPYAVAAAFILLYAVLIWSDSSSLTAGSAGSAEPGRRGATLAVHSTLGYAGGFLGPLALGATLDLFGGASVLGWGVAFGHVTVALLLGALAFVWLRPADLAGDRSLAAATASAPPLNRA